MGPEGELEIGIVAAQNRANVHEQRVARLVEPVDCIVECAKVAIDVARAGEGNGRASNDDDRSAGQLLGTVMGVDVDFEHDPRGTRKTR